MIDDVEKKARLLRAYRGNLLGEAEQVTDVMRALNFGVLMGLADALRECELVDQAEYRELLMQAGAPPRGCA